MKIGISCYPSQGGSGVVATELGLELAKKGHTVHFISYKRPFRLNRLYENVFFHKVEVHEYPLFEYPPYSLALASKIVEVARRDGLDLIHAHYAIPHAISAWLASQMLKEQALPVVSTLHGTDITLVGQEPGYHPVTQFALRHAEALTAVSHSLAENTKEVFGDDLEVQCIHNFVDTNQFQPGERGELRAQFAGEDETLFLHLSNFRPVKRVDDVLKIFQQVALQRPARLILAGLGPERPAMKQLAQELNIEDRVHFLGEPGSLTDLMKMADIFLLPSGHESFGLVALEAMSSGVPVLASDTGGLPELITTGHDGFLSPVGDIESFVARALELIDDQQLNQNMRHAARHTATHQFSISHILPKYLDLYESLLG
jgi:L-malate glycosyltransferase